MGKLAKILRNNLKTRMTEKNMSQNMLSKKAGMTQSALNRLVNSDCSVTLNTLERLAKALEIAPYKLLIEDPSEILNPEDALLVIKKALKLR